MSHSSAVTILQAILGLSALKVHPLTGDHVKAAVTPSQRMGPGFNDTLVYTAIREMEIGEIFSFERGFYEVPGVTRRTR